MDAFKNMDLKRIHLKKLYKIILIIFFALVLTWGNHWYLGKVAPSLKDTSSIGQDRAVAYVAGGCFWCTESDFEKLEGVSMAVSGYMGGEIDSPSYNMVIQGDTGHREMVKVYYDPNIITYRRLVLELLMETDPTDPGGSFYDRGFQYTSAIYYITELEKQIAEDVIAEVEGRNIFDKPIVTAVEPAGIFWIAEKYHQNFSKERTFRYNNYRSSSGRDAFIESIWGSGEYDDLFDAANLDYDTKWINYQMPDDSKLREILTPLQYEITQNEGTESSFDNEYWDNHDEGIYVDIVSGEPLFSSTDKFDSGTGWPSFLNPININFVTEHDDYKLIVKRIEIRSKYADSHLGHIILDGPESNNYIRYCMNSASLKFIPKVELENNGLGEYLYFFE
jgi:peptide methionine sulfoxide reductase msrA/msrB